MVQQGGKIYRNHSLENGLFQDNGARTRIPVSHQSNVQCLNLQAQLQTRKKGPTKVEPEEAQAVVDERRFGRATRSEPA